MILKYGYIIVRWNTLRVLYLIIQWWKPLRITNQQIGEYGNPWAGNSRQVAMEPIVVKVIEWLSIYYEFKLDSSLHEFFIMLLLGTQLRDGSGELFVDISCVGCYLWCWLWIGLIKHAQEKRHVYHVWWKSQWETKMVTTVSCRFFLALVAHHLWNCHVRFELLPSSFWAL